MSGNSNASKVKNLDILNRFYRNLWAKIADDLPVNDVISLLEDATGSMRELEVDSEIKRLSISSGILSSYLRTYFDQLPDALIKDIFTLINEDGYRFKHAGDYKGVFISPQVQELREHSDTLAYISPMNQGLVSVIDRRFPAGIDALYESPDLPDMTDFDDVLASFEDMPDFSDAHYGVITDATVSGGVCAQDIDGLCSDINRLKGAGVTIHMLPLDTLLVSDLLTIFTQTSNAEPNRERKDSLLLAMENLVSMSVPQDIKRILRSENLYINSKKLRVEDSAHIHDFIYSNVEQTNPDSERGQRAVSQFYHHLLLNLATSNERIQEAIGYSPLSIMSKHLLEKSKPLLMVSRPLSALDARARASLIKMVEDPEVTRHLQIEHKELKVTRFTHDLGL